MRRETQHVLLLLLGGALMRIGADDTLLRYVRPSQRWPVLVAGAVMVVLAVVTYLRDLPARTPGPRPRHGAGDHGSHGATTAWLLLLPVLVIALVAPPALGADSVVRAGDSNASVTAAEVFPPLPAGPAPVVGLGEVVQRAMFDSTGTLDNRTIDVIGFTVRRGAEIELARLRISCCAADARASRVRLVGEAGDPAQDTWLRVVGQIQPGTATAATHWVPTMTVVTIEPIPAPPDPYEY